MSLETILYEKQKHELICKHLKEIVSIYDELIAKSSKNKDIIFFMGNKVVFNTHLNQTTQYCQILQKCSYSICEHEYIVDLIDITPEKSNQIEYCQLCGCTKG